MIFVLYLVFLELKLSRNETIIRVRLVLTLTWRTLCWIRKILSHHLLLNFVHINFSAISLVYELLIFHHLLLIHLLKVPLLPKHFIYLLVALKRWHYLPIICIVVWLRFGIDVAELVCIKVLVLISLVLHLFPGRNLLTVELSRCEIELVSRGYTGACLCSIVKRWKSKLSYNVLLLSLNRLWSSRLFKCLCKMR